MCCKPDIVVSSSLHSLTILFLLKILRLFIILNVLIKIKI